MGWPDGFPSNGMTWYDVTAAARREYAGKDKRAPSTAPWQAPAFRTARRRAGTSVPHIIDDRPSSHRLPISASVTIRLATLPASMVPRRSRDGSTRRGTDEFHPEQPLALEPADRKPARAAQRRDRVQAVQHEERRGEFAERGFGAHAPDVERRLLRAGQREGQAVEHAGSEVEVRGAVDVGRADVIHHAEVEPQIRHAAHRVDPGVAEAVRALKRAVREIRE